MTPAVHQRIVALAAALHLALNIDVGVSAQKLNDIVVLGSHNSYHLLDSPRIPEWGYEHPPLAEQAENFTVRHFELDLQEFDADAGTFSISHTPGFDEQSSCATLRECSEQLRQWSTETSNGTHIPLIIFLNNKVFGDDGRTVDEWRTIDTVITEVWGEDLITPESLQGEAATLKEALIDGEWPDVDSLLGKALYTIDSTQYISIGGGDAAFLQAGFPTDEDIDNDVGIDENVVFLGIDDATTRLEAVATFSREGYMIRSRTDTPDDFLIPTPTNEELLFAYFDTFDQDNNEEVVVDEISNFAAAVGFPITQEQLDQLGLLLLFCTGSSTSVGRDAEDLACIRDRILENVQAKLPPQASDFLSIADVEVRRDGTLGSGVSIIGTDYFQDCSGGYLVNFYGCEYQLNPTSELCASPPETLPQECTLLCEGAVKDESLEDPCADTRPTVSPTSPEPTTPPSQPSPESPADGGDTAEEDCNERLEQFDEQFGDPFTALSACFSDPDSNEIAACSSDCQNQVVVAVESMGCCVSDFLEDVDVLNGTDIADADAVVHALLGLCDSTFFFEGTLAECSGSESGPENDVSGALALSSHLHVAVLLVVTAVGASVA